MLSVSGAQAKDNKKYYRQAIQCFSLGQEATAKDRLHEAYDFYTKAREAAAASKRFERLKDSERQKLDSIVRESRGEQFRLFETTGNFQELIAEGKIARGMTKEHVLLSWGEPVDISKKIYKWEELETWHYGNTLQSDQRLVYFKDGIVVDYKDMAKRYRRKVLDSFSLP